MVYIRVDGIDLGMKSKLYVQKKKKKKSVSSICFTAVVLFGCKLEVMYMYKLYMELIHGICIDMSLSICLGIPPCEVI